MKNRTTILTADSRQPTAAYCPLISVIVPIYNTENYLDECIASIVSQTYKNLEIILIDDGSTDNSPEICDEWAKKDARVRVIHKENVMKGELIGFVDSDDYIAHDMYEKLYGLMIQNDADSSVCNFYVFKDSKETNNKETNKTKNIKPLDILSPEQALTSLAKPGTSYGLGWLWNKLYKAELFSNVRFPAGNRHDDTARIHRILGSCRRIAVSYEYLFFHRVRSESVMGKIASKNFNIEANIKSWQDEREAFKDRYEYLESIGMKELAEFSRLRSYNYAVMALILQKANYFQYRKDITKFMGCKPFQLAVKLLCSKNPDLMKRAVKLMLLWFRSMFNPRVKYVPLTEDGN